MKETMKWAALILAAGALVIPGGRAQNDPAAGGPPESATSTNEMQWRKEILQERQKIMTEMDHLDSDLDKQISSMNQAKGNAKLDAMAAAINDLAKEHNLIRDRVSQLQQRISSHMQQQPMGGAGAGEPPGGRP